MADKSEYSWQLLFRVEQPIQGCELLPHAYLKVKSATLDNAGKAKVQDANPHTFTYQWSRGPKRQICSHEGCPRRDSFNPIDWSRFIRGGPELQCAICSKAGIPRHEALFCSAKCFRSAWSQHCAQHTKFDVKKKIEDLEAAVDLEEEYVDVSPAATLAEEEWIPVCSERQYTPVADDVGHIFRLECSAISTINQEVISGPVVIFSEPVLAAPTAPPRRTLSTIPGAGSSANGQHRFRVLSYNILAEVYATRHVYPYCDPWSLYWPYRRSIILAEIAEAQGDLVCLQEVQADYYEHDILPRLTELGYDGIFKQKTRESMGQHGKVDGCAVFWRRNKFIMLQNYAIEFNECARHTAAQLGVDEAEQSRIINRLSRDNVAQVVVFEVLPRVSRSSRHSAPNSNHICVVNTHLYANHTRPDVKLWQSYTLMKEIEQFVVHQELALLICGDFNSEPSSSVYQYLADGTVDRNHEDLAVDPMKVLPDSDNIIHSVDLSSVMVTAFGSEPEFTNYTKSFKGTLDYIWYTPGRLRVLAVTNIPQESDITEHGEALPSVTYPSDHIMLSADMCLAVTGSVNLVRNPAQQQQQQRKQNMHSNGSPPPKGAKNQILPLWMMIQESENSSQCLNSNPLSQ